MSLIVLIATSGVALGTAALIVTLAILSGFEKTLTENVVGFTAHAEIASYGGRPLPDYTSATRVLRSRVPDIKELSPYVLRQVVLRSPKSVAWVGLKGVLPNDTLPIARKKIKSGVNFGANWSDTLPPILISRGLATELRTDVGKSLMAIRFHENMKTREDLLDNLMKFRVAGIFETGMSEYDNKLAYTTLEAAQIMSGFSAGQVSGYDVMTSSLDNARALTVKLNHAIRYPYVAQSVYDLYQPIFAWIKLQKQPIPIILGLIIIVATFNVISTILLIVIEKTHSIGILKALGASHRGVARIFLTQGFAIAVIGTLLGNAVALGICSLESHYHFFKLRSDIYFMSHVPVSIEWQHYVLVSFIALILTLAATWIPARVASRMAPLHALNFG